MNKRQEENITESLKLFRPSNLSGSHRNCIRLNPSCSDKHNNEIVRRCLINLKLGIPFFTEVITLEGQRVDILLPSVMQIEEILVSETKERFEAKNYPLHTKAIRIK